MTDIRRLSHFRKRLETKYYSSIGSYIDEICQDASECFDPLNQYNEMAQNNSVPVNDYRPELLDHLRAKVERQDKTILCLVGALAEVDFRIITEENYMAMIRTEREMYEKIKAWR